MGAALTRRRRATSALHVLCALGALAAATATHAQSSPAKAGAVGGAVAAMTQP